jgi:hypothetical protein
MSCQLHFDLDVTDEDLLSLLMRREMSRHPALAEAVEEMDVDAGIGGAAQAAPVAEDDQPEVDLEATSDAPVAPEPPPPPPPPPPPAPKAPTEAAKASPRAARAKAAAGTNGQKPLAAPVLIPKEADLRALLSKVSTVHPAKIAGAVALVEEHGGFRRLNDCPTETWPAIWAAAEVVVAAAEL